MDLKSYSLKSVFKKMALGQMTAPIDAGMVSIFKCN